MFLHRCHHKLIHRCLTALLLPPVLSVCLSGISGVSLPVSAASEDSFQKAADERKLLPIQSNDTENWPEGPEIGAEAAILMDINTGSILYAKNIHEHLYPASTTKILTCLLAVENAKLSDEVVFSDNAVHSVPSGGSNMGMDAGQSLPLEECLYGIMVGSANEAANAVAEHVAGSIPAFAQMMNARAKELGCQDSHFANANGLFDKNHYTSAYDLATIAGTFFKNELLCKIADTPTYHFTPSAGQPDDFYLHNKHKLINGDISYDGIVGGKTGYTDEARETLVTCAERNGMKLVCVILKEESPAQFTDTTTLFDYGFNNFQTVNIASQDTDYIPDNSSFFNSDYNIFGTSGAVLSINSGDYIILPKNATIKDTKTSVTYNTDSADANAVAQICFTYNGVSVGSADVDAVAGNPDAATESSSSGALTPSAGNSNTVYLNIRLVIAGICLIAGIIILITVLHAVTSSYHFEGSRKDRRRFRRRKRETRKKGFGFQDHSSL